MRRQQTYVIGNVEFCVGVNQDSHSLGLVVDGGQMDGCVTLLQTQRVDTIRCEWGHRGQFMCRSSPKVLYVAKFRGQGHWTKSKILVLQKY